MDKEYNSLTKRLLAEGYTVDNFPDNVEIGRTCPDKDNPLRNFDGGFTYKRWWIYNQTFMTPCGLQCKGMELFSGLSYNGTEWTFENDLQLVMCPYRKDSCEFKHKDAGVVNPYHCNVHLVDEKYRYDGSVEALEKLHDDEIRRDKISFILQHKGHVCQRHMFYDQMEKQWKFNYDPEKCARYKCYGCYGGNDDTTKCPVLGRPLSKKKGNVYYDVKTHARRYDLDGTLFEGQTYTEITKGKRFFTSPISIDLCNIFVNTCKDRIRDYVNMKYSQELFFNNYYGREFSVEVINIRSEQKESRDLIQDLQDIKAGISVVHNSDLEKSQSESKREKREISKKKKITIWEKKIIKTGYENLSDYDQNKACRLLGFERIDELEVLREEMKIEEKNKPVQLSLFDLSEEE